MKFAERVATAWKRRTNPTFALCEALGADGLTFLDMAALGLLAAEAKRADNAASAEAVFIEVGCARGGSSIVITRSKSPQRQFEIYDVFTQIPPPTAEDFSDSHERYELITSGKAKNMEGRTYYAYESVDLLELAKESFRRYDAPPDENSVRFIRGDVRETLPNSGPAVAFAHIDCDWYEPVRHCLESILPRLVHGGVIVVDDYYYYKGCTAAVWDVLRYQLESVRLVYGPRLVIQKEK